MTAAGAAAEARDVTESPAAVLAEDIHKRFGALEVLRGVSLLARGRRRDRHDWRFGLGHEHFIFATQLLAADHDAPAVGA